VFANAAFAQTGFAGLGFGYFPATVTESLTSGDSYIDTAQFSVVQTETFTSFSNDSEQSLFYEGIVEAVTQADSSTQTSAFYYTYAEPFTAADTESIAAQFVSSVTEALTSADAEVIGSAYFFTQTEALSSGDSYVATASFPLNITEGTTVAELEAIAAQFAQTVVEGLISAESYTTGGWLRINDSQTPQWGVAIVTISGYGIPGDFLFGGAPIAGQISNTTTQRNAPGFTPVITWTKIDDTQAANWVQINNTQ